MEKNENLERTYFKKVKNYGECSKSIVSQSGIKLVMVSGVEPLCGWQSRLRITQADNGSTHPG